MSNVCRMRGFSTGLEAATSRINHHMLCTPRSHNPSTCAPFIPWQDTPGVLARSVLDAAMVLDVIAGPDPKDSTCIPAGNRSSGGGNFASGLLAAAAAAKGSACPLEGVTVGIPKEFNVEELGEMDARPAPRGSALALVMAWNGGS